MRILIADDEVEIRKVLRLLLENSGYEASERSRLSRYKAESNEKRDRNENNGHCANKAHKLLHVACRLLLLARARFGFILNGLRFFALLIGLCHCASSV